MAAGSIAINSNPQLMQVTLKLRGEFAHRSEQLVVVDDPPLATAIASIKRPADGASPIDGSSSSPVDSELGSECVEDFFASSIRHADQDIQRCGQVTDPPGRDGHGYDDMIALRRAQSSAESLRFGTFTSIGLQQRNSS